MLIFHQNSDPVIKWFFYSLFLAAFKAGKIAQNPFAQPPPGMKVPPPGMTMSRMIVPPPGVPGNLWFYFT